MKCMRVGAVKTTDEWSLGARLRFRSDAAV